jgi:hypothetical protein
LRKESILSAVVLALLFASLSATVYADTTVSVYIMNPFDSSNGAKGLSSGGYWAGEIPVKITGSGPAHQTVAYCIDFDKLIYIGGTYPATIKPVADTTDWRAVSYLLTWDYPTTNNEAAIDQVAVWRLLNATRGTPYIRESWLDTTIDNAGSALAGAAYGKDVVRKTDIFNWISPISSNGSTTTAKLGEEITFTAQLKSSSNVPRANVRVLFSASLIVGGSKTPLDSTYVIPTMTHTNSEGKAQVTIKVPSNAPLGSSIEVKASTKSMWPQHYIDINDISTQDLIGIGETFELTVSSNICIIGYIMVVPESPLGALTAIGAFGAAFALWTKFKLPKKKINA